MAKSKSSQPKPAVTTEEKPQPDPVVNETSTEKVEESKSSQPKLEMSTATVTSQVTSSSATPPVADKRLVKVLIKYPEDYPAKKRFFQDGEIKAVSAESAEGFIAAGFATKVE